MITTRAFAKLTLSLRVLGRRADGFHEIDALTVSVSEPHDELGVELAGDGVTLVLRGPVTPGLGAAADNLAVRAAHAFLDHVGRTKVGVRIELHKHIPAGAGLGGGSADAAAVLLALDGLLETGLPTAEIAAIGAALGSDIPFCVHGGPAHMRGRGERIEPAEVPTVSTLIAVPPFAMSTPAVYRAWDELGGPRAKVAVGAPAGLRLLTNDLEPAAEHLEPRLSVFREQLERAAGTGAILAGSGSAYVALFETAVDADAARDRVVAAGIAPTCFVGVTRS